jgi:hypothetical protein
VSVATATYAGRRAANRRFIDWCRVERPNTEGEAPVLDPDTLTYPDTVTPDLVLIYEGPFALQVRSDINANAVEAVIAEHEDTYRTGVIQFPVVTPASDKVRGRTDAILADDQLTIVRCRLDPSMNGRVLNLQADTKGKTAATMRRFRSREALG